MSQVAALPHHDEVADAADVVVEALHLLDHLIRRACKGRTRIDQMEKCGHYKHWKMDFDLLDDLDIQVLRYGPPLHKTFIGPGRYDWSFADMTFAEIERRNIIPIVDLCHFGVPDWIGNFQNPDFPDLFAAYAEDFARRFPWVQLYTPINEIFI